MMVECHSVGSLICLWNLIHFYFWWKLLKFSRIVGWSESGTDRIEDFQSKCSMILLNSSKSTFLTQHDTWSHPHNILLKILILNITQIPLLNKNAKYISTEVEQAFHFEIIRWIEVNRTMKCIHKNIRFSYDIKLYTRNRLF